MVTSAVRSRRPRRRPAAHHRPPRRQRPSARAHARGLPPGGGDGRRLHRAGPRLDEGRRAHRAPRERDRRHDRRRRAVSRSQAHQDDRRPVADRLVHARTSRSPRSRRCARRSGCAFRSHDYDGRFQVPTFDEVIALAQQLGTSSWAGRSASTRRRSTRPTSAASACRSRSRCSRHSTSTAGTAARRRSSSSRSSRATCASCARRRRCGSIQLVSGAAMVEGDG